MTAEARIDSPRPDCSVQEASHQLPKHRAKTGDHLGTSYHQNGVW